MKDSDAIRRIIEATEDALKVMEIAHSELEAGKHIAAGTAVGDAVERFLGSYDRIELSYKTHVTQLRDSFEDTYGD